MITQKNFNLDSAAGKTIAVDVYYKITHKPKPIVIFCHGYKGFKDWGAWDLIANTFAENDFFFIKFNFSHNGITKENPTVFTDLEGFAEDNFSKQLQDLESVMDWILTTKEFVKEANVTKVNLIGHSRGGAISIIEAAENKHITQLATWASVSDLSNAFPKGETIEEWKAQGVFYVTNKRTRQEMPHHYQFYEDYLANEDRFNLKKASRHLRIPQLIIHAVDDKSVSKESAKLLHRWNSHSKLFLVKEGGHTFGSKHPWQEKILPESLAEVTQKTVTFFKNH